MLVWLAAAAVLGGCGGDEDDDRRDSVNKYLRDVNAVQATYAPSFTRANKAYLAFSKGKLGADLATRRLTAAETAMRDSRDRVASLAAPTEARELKRRIVALLDADAALAHEATLLAGFVPAAQKASRPITGLGRQLSRTLKTAKTPKEQEAALRRYADGLARVIRKLVPLKPPPLMIDRHHDQLEHLRSVRRLSLQLIDALKAQDGSRVARLLLRFRKLSAAGSAGGAVSSAALRAYERRRRAGQRALQSVEREQRRLEEKLR